MKRILSLLLLMCLIIPVTANAQTIQRKMPEPSFVITAESSGNSSMFTNKAKAGDKLAYTVKVKNVSSKRSTFKIYSTDVIPTLRGGWSYPASSDKTTLVGSWFDGNVIESTLDSKKSETYRYTLTVPKNIKDGQYIGAIVVEEFIPSDVVQTSGNMTAASNMYMRTFVQTVININKDKSIHKVEIKDIYHELNDNGFITVYVPHVNRGTILEKPSGRITLKNSLGEIVKEEDYSMDSVYVGTTGLYDLNMTDILPTDTYTLSYITKYDGKELSGEYTFKVTQKEVVSAIDKGVNLGKDYKSGLLDFLYMYWIWISIAIIFFILLIMIIILLLLRLRKENKEDKTNTIQEQGETM